MNASTSEKTLQAAIETAVNILSKGGVIAIPTDTIYGLAGSVFSDKAVSRVFDIKRRPTGMALPVLLAEPDDIFKCAIEIPDVTWQLVERFWPGGLTIVLKKSAAISDLVSGGMDSVALRVPDHWIPRKISSDLGQPITGTSANRSGMSGATNAQAVRDEFGNEVDLIVDGGETPGVVSSTVLDLSRGRPQILRTGVVSENELTAICGDVLTN